jgi:putative toxin-antitoxin system antitoxin component (TIGR02293 family)
MAKEDSIMPNPSAVAVSDAKASHALNAFLKKVRSARSKGLGSGTQHWYILLLDIGGILDTSGLVQKVEKGLPFSTFTILQHHMDLPLAEMAEITQIKYRTLSRRRQSGRLEPDESDRLLRVTRLFGSALELFEGNEDATRRWLAKKQKALGGFAPLELAKTEIGTAEVERLIGRLEHGVFT